VVEELEVEEPSCEGENLLVLRQKTGDRDYSAKAQGKT